MLKVGMIGVLVTFLSMLFRKEKGEYAVLIGIASGLLIFSYILSQIKMISDFLQELVGKLPIENTYLGLLFKMLGITYIAEFSTSICKDAGYSSLAGQIELFAKLSILALSIPGITYILELLEKFL